METFYVTTPIYYANDLPHLGSLYPTIVADCLRRYKRQRGYETYFLTGTDEHGINIQRMAERKGVTPREYTDQIVAEFKKLFSLFSLDTEHGGYDIFMRTTEAFHYQGVAELWRRVAASKTPKGNDAIYKSHYEGWFCPSCAEYKTEDEYQKPEKPGEAPTCLVHLKPLDRVSEESYFFRLSDYDEALLKLYEDPEFVQPEGRRNEVISFVRTGLQDLSISREQRSVSWAIPVPDDPGHSIYVWFDALINYITAIGFGNEERERVVGFEKFWPAVHLVGKDILRQHAIYWPAFLLAAGIEPPQKVFAHGMWLDPNGRKMSKTLGNTIDLDVLHRYFATDAVRYFCLREMVFGQDGRFGYETLIDRANSDLASGLGNLSSRTLTMIARYCEGRVPSGKISDDKVLLAKRAGVDSDEANIAGFVEHARDQFLHEFDNFAFSRALEVIWSIIARVDKIISDAKPWDLAKDENQRQTLNAVLYRAAETLRWLCVLLQPVMPEATQLIYKQLGLNDSLAHLDPGDLKWGGLTEGTQIGEVKPLFPRIDKAKTMAEIKNESEGSSTPATEPDAVASAASEARTKPLPPMKGVPEADAVSGGEGVTSFIEIGDFAKVDLRVGQVLTAERIPKADKLLLLSIDIGEEKPRQILAGIAEYYEPEKLVGRKIVVVANLKPRKLRGYESQGMLLAASVGEEGKPVIATFTEDVPNGARLK
jgi:methionyl-tRNA synthetase